MITPEVVALRDHFGFPGMRVLQFAFSNDPTSKDHQPHNYLRNCIVYTGTHDNNTTVGWFDDLSALEAAQPAESTYSERATALKYLGADGREVHWDMIRVALASGADMAIIPLQDVLGLGSEARMNRPATSVGNWEWRFTSEALTDEVAARLGEMTRIYGRVAD